MAANQPLSRLLQFKRQQLTPKQLATMQEFHQTIAAIQAEQYRGDKHKVYLNYAKKTIQTEQ